MKILVVNAGSSTLKFQLIDMETKDVLAKGNCERIGDESSFMSFKTAKANEKFEKYMPTHASAIAYVLDKLVDEKIGVIASIKEIDAFGHRVVNVGEKYFDSCQVTPEILEDFKRNVDFSPLHVPGSIAGMEACMSVAKGIPNVAVFDIGFHKTLPAYAYRYAIPQEDYNELKIRRYGAHGTSHYFVANECARIMEKDIKDLKIVTCHLGSGASVTAVDGGKSIDTSMGFTPLEGLIMGTRSGDIDASVVEFLCNKRGLTVSQVINRLNKQSGLLGANGKYNDMRDILAHMDDEEVQLSLDMFNYRVKKYIGAYSAAMGGLDAIVFTAGIGEYTPEVREGATNGLEFLGVKVDHDLNFNAPRGQICEISASDSKVKVYIIPTNEEYVIAKETEKLVK